MPQLDLIIVFPQIFWLLITFFFTYTVIVHFFLPLFVKSLKARKRIVLENTELLLYIQEKSRLKQIQLNTLLNKNFCLVKIFLEKEINNLFTKESILNLNSLDIKIIEALYHNILYYDINVLDSVPLNPKFSNIKFEN